MKRFQLRSRLRDATRSAIDQSPKVGLCRTYEVDILRYLQMGFRPAATVDLVLYCDVGYVLGFQRHPCQIEIEQMKD